LEAKVVAAEEITKLKEGVLARAAEAARSGDVDRLTVLSSTAKECESLLADSTRWPQSLPGCQIAAASQRQ
jgi:hypothetical protein